MTDLKPRNCSALHIAHAPVRLAILLLALAAPAALAQRYVAMPDSLHPRLKYADSLTSLNDRCAVSHAKLNPKVRPVYVNGQPIGFC